MYLIIQTERTRNKSDITLVVELYARGGIYALHKCNKQIRNQNNASIFYAEIPTICDVTRVVISSKKHIYIEDLVVSTSLCLNFTSNDIKTYLNIGTVVAHKMMFDSNILCSMGWNIRSPMTDLRYMYHSHAYLYYRFILFFRDPVRFKQLPSSFLYLIKGSELGKAKFFELLANYFYTEDLPEDLYAHEIENLESLKKSPYSDKQFGKLFLDGLQCNVLCKYVKGKTPFLEFWIKKSDIHDVKKTIYYADYSEKINKNIPIFWVIFQLNTTNELLPICITYMRSGVWTNCIPTDIIWEHLKKIVIAAATIDALVIEHALVEHLMLEPFAVAMYRNIPPMHVLYKLLNPHFKDLFAMIFNAKTLLISKNGIMNKIVKDFQNYIAKKYNKMSFVDFNFEDQWKNRGFTQEASDINFELSGFTYAKDSTEIWEIIKCYVSDVIFEKYKTECDLINDKYVTSFMLDLQLNGFNSKFNLFSLTRNSFANLLATVIHLSSVRHKSSYKMHIHFLVYGYYIVDNESAIPENITFKNLHPDFIHMTKVLTRHYGTDKCLLDTPDETSFFNLAILHEGDEYKRVALSTQKKFLDLENKIASRSTNRYYKWFLPSKIPLSAGI
jgi:hypothetical protein